MLQLPIRVIFRRTCLTGLFLIRARNEGLHAFTLTEHFNTDRFFDIYDTLDAEYPYVNEYYDIDGFKIFAGMEIDIQEGSHILFTGHRQTIRELRQQLDNYVNKESFIPVEELLILSESYNLLKIGAHPFRESNPMHHLPTDILKQFDAFDLNGKDLYKKGVEITQQEVYDFAAKLGKPVTAGSDAHHPLQLACVYNTLNRECHTIDDLRQVIQSKDYEVFISSSLPIKVKAASLVKDLMHENMKLSLLSVV